ncbi:MAG: thiol reductant ABC exporter subunit CydC, partial [Gammaproteobacteria bacterium]|nr:thiol reductant ABC exporter subunit CydC [Gammaproteobacteria bacterium]
TPAAGIRAFAIIRTLGRYAERLVNHDATLKLLSRLRVWVYAHIAPLSPAVLARYRKGDVLNRLVADVDALDNAWLRVFSPVAVAIVGTLAIFIFLLFVSTPIAWLNLALLIFIGVALPFATQRLGREPARAAAQSAGELKAALTENIAGLGELAVLGAAPERMGKGDACSRRLARAQDRGLAAEAIALAATVLATGVAITLTWLLLAPAASNGDMNPLILPLLIFLVLSSTEIVQNLPAAFRALGDTLAAARRVFSLSDETPAVIEAPRPLTRIPGYGVGFESVTFRYASHLEPALIDVTFELPEGTAMAIVGPSGAGKSSIAQLLLRFHDPNAGLIRVGDQPLENLALEPLRRQFAWAPQANRLFSTTIRENLRLASPTADDNRLWSALEFVGLADEVHGFGNALDHYVGAGGLALSAGQARRLALARAWLNAAPILLLDEPTEGLDAAIERRIIKQLAHRRGARSLLLITHRLNGLEAMDQILVMDRGRIVERGTHDSLIAANGFYTRMTQYLG